MGSANSKSKNPSPSKKSTAIIPAPDQKMTEAQPCDLMNVLRQILVLNPNGVNELIILYWWNFAEKTIKETPIPTLTTRWNFFGQDRLPQFMAKEAADNLIWGFPEDVERIITAYPRTLTILTEATDHIGKVEGYLYQIALKIKDNLNKDKKTGETMVQMLERHLTKHSGAAEIERQKDEVRPFLEAEAKRDAEKQVADEQALGTVWQALDASPNAAKLKEDKELTKAVDEFEKHLNTPGNWAVLIKGEQTFDDKYWHFNGYNNPKNNFFEDRILELIQKRRLRACELQILFLGLINIDFRQPVVAARVDVRPFLSATDHYSINILGAGAPPGGAPERRRPGVGGWGLGRLSAALQAFLRATTSSLESCFQNQAIIRGTSSR